MKIKIFKIITLSILIVFFTNCENKNNSQNNQAVLGLLLASSQSTNTGTNTNTSCPQGTVPSNIPIATTVVSANSTVSGFNNSTKAVNGICGAGNNSGGLDVYALNLTGAGATLKLSWAGKSVKNVSGIDFIVYENAFQVSETSDRYLLDPMVVEVSSDDVTYCGFTLTYDSTASTLNKISSWGGFAGLRPVIYNMTSKVFTLDELFTSSGDGFLLGGGDGFDLDNLITSASCTTTIRDSLKLNGIKYIKMVSASAVTNPNTGNVYTYPHAFDNASDIDGVIAKSVE